MLEVNVRGFYIIALLGLLTACVTTTVYKDLTMLDKDKDAGRIQMGFDYDSSQMPIVNHQLAMAEAIGQCRNWLYESATLLQGLDYKCTEGTENDCKRYAVVYTYQCLTAEDIKRYEEGKLDLTGKQSVIHKNSLKPSSK